MLGLPLEVILPITVSLLAGNSRPPGTAISVNELLSCFHAVEATMMNCMGVIRSFLDSPSISYLTDVATLVDARFSFDNLY